MGKDRIIVIGAGNISASAIAEKISKQVDEIIVVDDMSKAEELIKSPYTKKIMEIMDEEKVYKLAPSYMHASEMTKKEINAPLMQPVRTEPKIQNNQECPCNSGKKYKKCCKIK